MSVVNLGSLNNQHELLFHVFTFLTPEENVKNTMVCRDWKDVASEVAKRQYLESFNEKDVKAKMANFLVLAGGKFEDYTPQFQNAKQNWSTLTIQQVRDKVNSNRPQKFTVCLGGCFVVDPNCPNIPSHKVNDLAGKAFAEFHYRQDWSETSSYARLFTEDGLGGGIIYFPVELFNFNVEKDGTVTGEKNSGECCFSLKGRLIEVFLIKGDQNARDARWAYFYISRDKAPTIQLTPEDANTGYIWPQDIYVPRLDAKAANSSQDQSNQ